MQKSAPVLADDLLWHSPRIDTKFCSQDTSITDVDFLHKNQANKT